MKPTIILIFSLLALLACKKESQPTLTEDLAKNDWNKTQILISADSVVDTVPTIAIVPADCKKDNIWRFNATNNTFQLLEGATKCNVSDPDVKDQGSITEQNNGTQLKVEGTGTNEIWEIESFSASSFRVSYFDKNASNQTVKFRVTFSKI